MRLSGWRSKAPGRDGINQKVLDTVGPILVSLGAEVDPHCWVTWGDETGGRWTAFAPCLAGLAVVNVRAGGPQEGLRVGGRLVRWSKVQLGELAAESERGHRLVMFQIEGQPIRGTDDKADDVARFAGLALAGLEGRPFPDLDKGARRLTMARAKPARKPAVKRAAGTTARTGSPKPASKPATGSPLPAPRPANSRSASR
jgi:hypothetical protein